MLSVGVERCDESGSPGEGIDYTSLERRALAEIHRVAQDNGPGRHRAGCRSVRRTVIDHHHVWIGLAQVRDHAADHASLIEGGNHHENALGVNQAVHARFSRFRSRSAPWLLKDHSNAAILPSGGFFEADTPEVLRVVSPGEEVWLEGKNRTAALRT